jgi:hypothetical protein
MVIQSIPQQYPAIQEVALTWEGVAGEVNTNTSVEKDIQPNSRELLHVAFSDSTFPTTNTDPTTPIHAVISSKDLLDTFDNQNIIERGFIVGDFIIKITITANNAKSCYSYFSVHVGKEWNELNMKRFKRPFWRRSR